MNILDRIAIAAIAVAVIGAAGCSGSSGGTTATNTDIRPYIVADLQTGSIVFAVDQPSSSADRMVFTLVGGVYVAREAVSKGQWNTIMGGAGPWTGLPAEWSPSGDGYPANNLSPDDADGFVAAASSRMRRTVRLPTATEIRALMPAVATAANAVVRESGATGPSTTATAGTGGTAFPGIVGNIRQITSGGSSLGGAWTDNLATIGETFDGPDGGRHPLVGIRPILEYVP